MTVVAECVGWQRVRKASAVAECGGVLVAVATRGAAVAECVGDITKGVMILKRKTERSKKQVKEGPPSASKTKGRGQKRPRYYKNHASKTIVTVDMPVRCPEEDPTGTERRKIKMYVEDRKSIWLHIKDVEWAVRYLYVQNQLKGVPLIADDSTGPADAR